MLMHGGVEEIISTPNRGTNKPDTSMPLDEEHAINGFTKLTAKQQATLRRMKHRLNSNLPGIIRDYDRTSKPGAPTNDNTKPTL